MRFAALYRFSLYLLIIGATLLLNMDAEVGYARFYPMAMVVFCSIAFLGVDRDQRGGIPNAAANFLGILSLVFVYIEFKLDETQLVLAVGHWLFYLSVIKLLRLKTDADDWTLILLSLVQVLVGCVLSQSDRVGFTLLLWSILALWVLSLFYLQREARRRTSLAVAARSEPYPGLLAPPFLFATLRAAVLTLACGVFIFLAMPRSNARQPGARGPASAKNLTGFSEEIRLGQMGEILENESVVMSAELFDADQNRIHPESELLWRGVVLNRYERGRWSRGTVNEKYFQLNSESIPRNAIRQRIRLEPTSETVIFVLRPFIDIRARGDMTLEMSNADGSVVREAPQRRGLTRRRPSSALEYSLYSEPTQDLGGVPGLHIQNGEQRVLPIFREDDPLLEIPEELRARFESISRSILQDNPPRDVPHSADASLTPATLDAIARARALEAYLRDSGRFSYDLTMTRTNPREDPILDFLEATRRGHCEYFASSLAMLLRSAGIPCRVVNGFKGGDWNDIVSLLTVRQKHAHSWVEACVTGKTSPSIWLTLDPTPSAERTEEVARIGRVPGGIRQFSDFIRYVWVFYVAGFNADRQEEMLYGPIRMLLQEARNGFRIMGRALARALRWMTDYQDLSSFFSIRGFVTSCVAMLLLAGCYQLVKIGSRLLLLRIRGPEAGRDDLASVLVAYARLVRILASCGLERPAGETPREFARRAGLYLGDRAELGIQLADIPSSIVEAFYQIRFGGLQLAPNTIEALDHRVDTLESALRPAAP